MKDKIFIPAVLIALHFLIPGCQQELTGDGTRDFNGNAVFVLEKSGGDCLLPGVKGIYQPGVLLDTNNTISLKINVSKTGLYQISTNTVNGYSFKASGNFTTTGQTTVMLPATGTPVSAGSNKFTITGVTNACDIQIAVTNNTQITDHFPLATNCYWNYDNLLTTSDTLTRAITDSMLLGNSYYKKMKETYSDGSSHFYFFRKSGDDYFEYTSVDKYTSALTLIPPINDGIIFLKENLKTGQTWKSPEYRGTDSATGKPVMLQYVFICADAHANASINGVIYTNVYNITMQAYTRADANSVYQSAREINGFFYANGIGMLYMKKTNKFYNKMEIMIRNWKVL